MSGPTLAVQDDASKRLSAVPDVLRDRLLSVADALRSTLLARIKERVSGEALNVQTGELLASFSSTVAAGGKGVLASVSSNAPYAAILEHGGVIPAHEIMPTAAGALHFALGGGVGDVFARSVNVPDVHIQGRSFMGGPLRDMSGDITKAFGGALTETLRG